MWRSMMLLSAMKSVPHTPSRSSSRVTTWPARLASTYIRFCSMLLRWMTDVPVRTSRWRMSISTSPIVIVGTIGRPRSEGATTDDDRPGEQLLRRERRRQDVVHAEVERLELGRQVASPGQPEDRRPARLERVRGAEPLEQGRAVVVVHVDDRDVRHPFAEDALRFVEVTYGPDNEHAVVEGELDQVGHDRPIAEDQRVAGVVRGHGPDAVRHRHTPISESQLGRFYRLAPAPSTIRPRRPGRRFTAAGARPDRGRSRARRRAPRAPRTRR